MNRFKAAWKILTTDDWYMITRTPPELPFTLLIGDIEVYYRKVTR